MPRNTMMLPSWRACCALLLLLPAWAANAGTPPADLGARLVERHIRPAAARFVTATAALADATGRYCAKPRSSKRSTAVRDAFGTALDAWGALELLRFGPLAESNRYERVWFWPDPRGVAQRQLQAALAARDPVLLQDGALGTRSVALQGLPAFDYVLYADGAAAAIAAGDDAGRYRCGYATAIARQLHRIAGDVAAGWNAGAPFVREFTAPQDGNAHYRSNAEVAAEAAKALSTALQYQHDVAVLPPLGADPTMARVQRAPLWRSGMSARTWRAGMEGWRSFLQAAGFADGLAANERWMERNLLAEAGRVAADYAAIDALPLTDVLSGVVAGGDGPSGRDRLVHAALVTASMKTTVDELLVPALGVELGFNALDGD